jgi:cell division protease FtsH
MTQRLIEVESIDSEELAEIIEQHSPGPRLVPGTQAAPRPEAKPSTQTEVQTTEQTG